MLIMMVYGAHSGPPSSEVRGHGAHQPPNLELALRSHPVIGEAAAQCQLHLTKMTTWILGHLSPSELYFWA